MKMTADLHSSLIIKEEEIMSVIRDLTQH